MPHLFVLVEISIKYRIVKTWDDEPVPSSLYRKQFEKKPKNPFIGPNFSNGTLSFCYNTNYFSK
ncbi:MAG TPA: hypothetical protein DG757_03250 [Bacillus sp. (in: Bacteria)]|nr:hypothetical protein [Bacillus sp. (in: firmicutes)]